jgi:hypothetical protein
MTVLGREFTNKDTLPVRKFKPACIHSAISEQETMGVSKLLEFYVSVPKQNGGDPSGNDVEIIPGFVLARQFSGRSVESPFILLQLYETDDPICQSCSDAQV